MDGYLSFLDHAKGFVTDSWCIFHSRMANKMGLHFGQHSLVEVGAEGGQTKHETWDNDYESVKLSLFELIFLCHKPQLGMKVGGLNLEDCRPRNSTWEGKKQTGKSRKKPKLGSLGKLQAGKFRGNIHQNFSEIFCLIRKLLAWSGPNLWDHISNLHFPDVGLTSREWGQKYQLIHSSVTGGIIIYYLDLPKDTLHPAMAAQFAHQTWQWAAHRGALGRTFRLETQRRLRKPVTKQWLMSLHLDELEFEKVGADWASWSW